MSDARANAITDANWQNITPIIADQGEGMFRFTVACPGTVETLDQTVIGQVDQEQGFISWRCWHILEPERVVHGSGTYLRGTVALIQAMFGVRALYRARKYHLHRFTE